MTLGVALGIVCALLLVALVVQGLIWTRQARPRRAEIDASNSSRQFAERGERTDPELGAEPGAPEADATELRPAPPRRSARLDALIDAIVALTLEAPVAGDFVIAHLPPTRRAGTKPFYVEGLDAASESWEAPAPGRRYSELQAGVQMSGRSGALNEIEYSEFVQKVQAFAEAVGAMADFPDMLDVVARARELDALTGPLDAQLSVGLRSNGVAWSPGYLQQCASRHGFVPGAVPGRLVLPGAEEGAPPVLVLGFDPQAALAEDPQQAALNACTLTLDVAQTEERAEPFPAWHRVATLLADEMGATVVDDQGRPVTLHAFDAIGRDLQDLYRRLEALDLAAGSAAARRLFS
ncbi:MAG: cell division protein FtsZ [Burkholderiales bacterium]|nr:cell division protein FtsZ [Burkholderiales bacterium]